MIYLNAPDGRKPSTVSCPGDPRVASAAIRSLLPGVAFAQNLTTHVAQVATIVRALRPGIRTAVISGHEIRWLADMLRTPGHQPDATYSNARGANDPVSCPAFAVRMTPFASFVPADVPALHLVSHVSRLTGEIADIAAIHRAVKARHPDSLLVVDGAQALGVFEPLGVDAPCDVYLGTSSKFLGADPTLGLAFFSAEFRDLFLAHGPYPDIDPAAHAEDLQSLLDGLHGFAPGYGRRIRAMKRYAVRRVRARTMGVLHLPPRQSPGFLTFTFGSRAENLAFVARAAERGVIVSENAEPEWTLCDPLPLVRAGITVTTTRDDIDALVALL